MRERMARTFGDLNAVKRYEPPVQVRVPETAGPYTGRVSHALSGASPSPAAAGPMQAKKYKETKSVDREYDKDQIVNQGAEGYDTLDPKKWMTVTQTPTGLARIFGRTKQFKAKINRRAYDMTPEELAANKYNPGGYEELDKFQRDLSKNVDRHAEDDDKDYNGRKNRYAWKTFQKFGKNELTDDTKTADKSTWDKQSWGMKEIDQGILIPKLRNMARMVQDYPELQGNIGTLERLQTAEEEKNQPPKEPEIKPINTEEPKEKKKLRKRMKRTKTAKEFAPQPAPTDQAADGQEQQGVEMTYMQTNPAYLYTDEADKYKDLPMFKNNMKEYYRKSAFPLRMNSYADAATDEMRTRRAKADKRSMESNSSTAELEYSGNHEMGHMLNYLLVKEKNRHQKDRNSKNKQDFRFHTTADKLVDLALKQTMPEEEYKKLVRYEEDSLDGDEAWDPGDKLEEGEEWVTKDSDPIHKKGQINLAASGLGGTAGNRGYTSAYGATNSAEFFAEAFADVYRNGREARPVSIRLVQLYEKNMKYFKEKNAGKKRKLSEADRKDLLLD